MTTDEYYNELYYIKRGIHLILVVLCIPLTIIEALCISIGEGLRDCQDKFFDRVRDWVGYEYE